MLLPISGIVEVYRGNLDVWVKSVLIEQDCTTSIMGHIETIRQVVVKRDDVPFSAMCFSMAPSFPRRGPGFQL